MKKSSVLCTGAVVGICIILLLGLCVFAPWIADWYVDWRGIHTQLKTVITTAFYICVLPALLALGCLLALLRNILREQIFQPVNSTLIGVVSWCCVVVAVTTAAAAYWYLPFLFVAAAMLFLFLIVRVVRGCFNAAITLREENELTI